MSSALITTACCIAGGGPTGMMLRLLLARAGVDVVVLEKHADFLRDFRGDTIHPSTMGIIHELGWLEEFLRLPHQSVPRLVGQFGDTPIALADFSRAVRFIDNLKFVAGPNSTTATGRWSRHYPLPNPNHHKLARTQRRNADHDHKPALIDIRLRHGVAIAFDEIRLLGLGTQQAPIAPFLQ